MEAAQDMAMTSEPSGRILVAGADTPAKVLRSRCAEWADKPALRRKEKGIWHTTTWGQYYANVRAVALALSDLGLVRGDVVGVLAENRPEWLYADVAAQCMGMIGNGLYPTSSPEQVEYILTHSGTRVVFVEDGEQLDKVLAVRARCPRLIKIVVMDLTGLRTLSDPMAIPFADLMAQGVAATSTRAGDFEAAIDATKDEDVALLVYTSGTTGPPKGAMVTNRNLMFQIASAPQYLNISAGDRTLSFLPLCHIAERIGTAFNPLAMGQIVHFPENSGTVFNDMREVAPHMLFGPPRFWEKLFSQVEIAMQDAIAPARWIYRKAVERGRKVSEHRLAGRAPGAAEQLRFAMLRHLALANVREALGLQNIRCALTGAAPVPPDLLKWYMSIGIDLLEAFGMTETTGFCTATPPDRIKIGFAGVRATDTELKIGADGEILVRGPNVFKGYLGAPDKTAETIDMDGWLHTGDCGEIDPDGYLKITDRLKDIIITSGGKNISPTGIESLLKFSPYISDAVVIGESRNFLTCLIMLDQETVSKFAQDRQVPFTDFASLTRAPEVVALIRETVEGVNGKLARVEQVKDFRIIAELLTAEDEELTPTMKLKRKVVARRYKSLIDEMYPT